MFKVLRLLMLTVLLNLTKPLLAIVVLGGGAVLQNSSDELAATAIGETMFVMLRFVESRMSCPPDTLIWDDSPW